MRYSYEHPLLARERDPFLTQLFQQRGMVTFLARELNISKQAVSRWKHVPEEHVAAVASLLGFAQYRVRGRGHRERA